MFLKTALVLFCLNQLIFGEANGASRKLQSVNDNFETKYALDDMILTRRQMDNLFVKGTRRNGVKDSNERWPNKIVPVFINNDFGESIK